MREQHSSELNTKVRIHVNFLSESKSTTGNEFQIGTIDWTLTEESITHACSGTFKELIFDPRVFEHVL